MNNRPPKWADRFLQWIIKDEFIDEIQGDLHEWYKRNVELYGVYKANWKFVRDVIGSMAWFRIKKLKLNLNSHQMMWKSYLKTGIRNLLRKKIYTAISISGMSIAVAAAILITFHVEEELSYDTFYPKGDQIFRVINQRTNDGIKEKDSGGPVPLANALREFPEIEKSGKLWSASTAIVRFEGKVFKERGFMFADPEILEIFDLGAGAGKQNPLTKANSIIITESIARKYFGDNDPVGKVIEYDGYPGGEKSFTITRVIKDLPPNTHLQFDFLASATGLTTEQDNWGSFKPIYTYILIRDKASSNSLESKLPEFTKRVVPSRVEENDGFSFTLEPLKKIHFSDAWRPMKPAGTISSLIIVITIGFLILVMATLNFVNLNIATSISRYREVGIRKVMGAMRMQLISQFLFESIIILIFSAGIGIVILHFVLPWYSSITGKNFEADLFGTPEVIGIISCITFLVLISAGIYPSWLLARIKPAVGLKSLSENSLVPLLSKSLIFIQFAITLTIIIATLSVKKQLNFLEQMDLGFNKENLIILSVPQDQESVTSFLRNDSRITGWTISQRLPANDFNYDGRIVMKEGEEQVYRVQSNFVDPNYLRLFEISLLSGRNFIEGKKSDTSSFIINKKLAEQLGWDEESALGKPLQWSGYLDGVIIGVMRDVNLGSLHEEIPGQILLNYPQEKWWRSFLTIRVHNANYLPVINDLHTLWKATNPKDPFEYHILADNFVSMHKPDEKLGKLLSGFSIIALLLACIGLYGISAFSVTKRKKEVSIRKVFGANSVGITMMISLNYLKYFALSAIVSLPLAYYLLDRWLATFAYHDHLSLVIFSGGLLFVAIIILFTVGYHTIMAANANPASVLRNE